MKYYCTGKPIPLVKLGYSSNLFANLPLIGTPVFGKLSITENKMRAAFEQSHDLIMCKSLEDAKALRNSKIIIGNTNVEPAFIKGAIATGYPLHDFAIYEVEVDDNHKLDFSKLTEVTDDQLKNLVSQDVYFRATLYKDRSGIPDIEICSSRQSDINPKLIACHYYSLVNGQEEQPSRSLFMAME